MMSSLNTSPDTSLAMLKASQTDVTKFTKMQGKKNIDEAAREFEAVFVSEMMKPMFEGLKTDGMFGGGQGEKIFRGVMLQEFGKKIAQTDKIGIASKIKEAMLKLQEEQGKKAEKAAASSNQTTSQMEGKTS